MPIHPFLNQNRSLIFQFFLDEFFCAGLEISQSMPLVVEDELTSLPKIKTSFSVLVGTSEIVNYWAWNSDQGLLLRLKHHASSLIAGSDHRLSNHIQLEKLSTFLWKISLDILHVISQLEQNKRIRSNREICKKQINHFISTFNKVSLVVLDLIKEFSSDENVIFFLLRNKYRFDTIYGSGHLKKMLGEMHPEGISQASIFLKNKFIARGFEVIADKFSAKYLELDSS